MESFGEQIGADTETKLHDDLVSSLASIGGCTSARTGLYLDYHELRAIRRLVRRSTRTRIRVSILAKLGPVIETAKVQHDIMKSAGVCIRDMGPRSDDDPTAR